MAEGRPSATRELSASANEIRGNCVERVPGNGLRVRWRLNDNAKNKSQV